MIYALIEAPDTIDAAPSLGAIFNLWTEQLENGDYRYGEDEWESLDGPLVFIPKPTS